MPEKNSILIVLSGNTYVGCFSSIESAQHFCNIKNESLDDFVKADEEYTCFVDTIDKLSIDENMSVKMYWDYQVDINPNTSKYGSISYVGTGKELTRRDKVKDVEQYVNTIFCRSYESKAHAERLCSDAWQTYQQEVLIRA